MLGYTPPADAPLEQTSPGANTLQEQTPPLGADTPHRADTPPEQCMLGDMGNKRVVPVMMIKCMVFRYMWVYSKEDTMAHTRRPVVTSKLMVWSAYERLYKGLMNINESSCRPYGLASALIVIGVSAWYPDIPLSPWKKRLCLHAKKLLQEIYNGPEGTE